MRLARLPLLFSLGALLIFSASRSHETRLQAGPEFLFERHPFQSNCAAPPAGPRLIIAGRHLPFQRKHAQNLTLPLSQVPALTLTADESNMIHVAGSDRDSWFLSFCAQAEGNTESEALAELEQASMERIGATVSVNNLGGTDHTRLSQNTLLVAAPAAAPTVIYASSSAVRVQDMTGPVRVTATHARATILDTTGKVDASGWVVDFAGSEGTVKLSSEAEINLKLRAPRFKGSLMAWAQGPVRVLVPRSFQTPFQAIVSRPQDFAPTSARR